MTDEAFKAALIKITERGERDGKAAGSWVIDGNTSDEHCEWLLKGMNDGDPMVADSLPCLQLGQWADDPQFSDILSDEDIDTTSDEDDQEEIVADLWVAYSDGWANGANAEVERACIARLEVA